MIGFARLLLLFCLVGCESESQGSVHVSSFMPENDLHLDDRTEVVNQVTKEVFLERTAQAQAFYGPIVAVHGGELKIVANWDDATVNAYASREGKVWKVAMFGGLARREEITPDAYSLVIGHEIGHHVSGFPFYPNQGWKAGCEGNADYFSTLSYGKQLWKNDLETNAEFEAVVHPLAKADCDGAWQKVEDKHLCYRLTVAGKSLADLLSRGRAKYETPDKAVVTQTFYGHGPTGQCRLQSYHAGALCNVYFDPFIIPQSDKEAAKYSCLKSKSQVGYRPTCWFKEKSKYDSTAP